MSLSLRPLFPGGALPLLATPDGDADPGALIEALSGSRDAVQAALTEAGAVLLRGWAVHDARTFEQVARAIEPQLQNEYLGTSPRNGLTSHVFTASELPPHFPIPQHNEMSFTRTPPKRLFFCCMEPNRAPGGETPLVDMRRVWKDLDPEVRARFETLGIRNVRNYAGPPEPGTRVSSWDPWKLKRWDEMFGTTDRPAVLERCAREGFEATFTPGGGLRLVNTQPAMKAHPRTAEPVWFNHSQVFHGSAAPAEYARIAGRLGVKWRGWGLLASTLLAVKSMWQSADEAGMHCTFGDGSPIPTSDMDAVRDAIWRNLVAFPWERGDVVVIDNDAVAHGRMPFQGPRMIVVSWA